MRVSCNLIVAKSLNSTGEKSIAEGLLSLWKLISQIQVEIQDKKVIGSNHHRFMKGKPCLIDAYNEMTSSMDEDRAVDVVYLDFSTSFHSVS